MEKQKKLFSWKKFGLIVLALVISFGISALSFVLIVTADARLDIEKLTGAPSPLIILSSSKQEISSSTYSKMLGEINDHTKNAFIAIEDKRFLSHNGIDIKRIGGAIFANIKSMKKSQGASTITQQLVKNTHLSRDKTLKRKLREIKIALQVEKKLSKDEIMNSYLNNIYFGNGCLGIEAASQFYFGKMAKDLNLPESALLAGLVKAPSATEPVNHFEKAIKRRNLVLKLMLEQNLIDNNQYNDSINYHHDFVLNKSNNTKALVQAIKEEAKNLLNIDLDSLEKSSLVIETYADLEAQHLLEDTIKNNNYTTDQNASSLGSIIVDSKNGGIIAYCSSGEFDFINSKRQPASTIKPILVYAPAIEEGLINPESFILDDKTNFNGYQPQNAGNMYSGWITIRESLAKSKNIPAVKILDMLGIEKSKSYAKKMDLPLENNDNNLAIALGGLTNGFTLKSIAGAYTTLNDGFFKGAHFIKSIKTADGTLLYERNLKYKKVFSEDTSYLVTNMLQDCASLGTGKKLNSLPFEIATKTGTVGNKEYNTDCYNIAYTSEHIFATLVTKGDSKTNFDTSVNGSTMPTNFNKVILEKFYDKNYPDDFCVPDSVVKLDLDIRATENYELKLADPSTEQRYRKTALFSVRNKPYEYFNELDKSTKNIFYPFNNLFISNPYYSIDNSFEIDINQQGKTMINSNYDDEKSELEKIIDEILD